ncbi:MAG: hypothetical protein IJB31_03125, partial [Akkermansia sp.]|nr:hypothetical protein [Akkermansia sp.]
MKLRVNFSLRKALLACMSAVVVFSSSAAWGTTPYMVEGVDANNYMDSELFYDAGKGYYWTWDGYEPYEGAKKLYKETNSYAFLGDLAGRVATSSGISKSTFNNLTYDANTCWYNVASNVLQYWQSCYGVFASDIVYGYTYNKDYADDLGGTQSLKLGMYFYDNWNNTGGNLQMAATWYLQGTEDDDYYSGGSLVNKGKGGFYYQYFGDADSTQYTYADEIAPASMADVLADHLGMEKQKDGSYKVVRHGQLADLSVHHYSGSYRYGHALTLYGFSVDDKGMLESVHVTNSDDQTYKLFTLYVKYVDGEYRLYEDAACKNLWTYAEYDWQIESVSSIKTPALLQQMYADYTSADTPQVWTGKQSTWKAPQAYSIGEALPDATTGWDVKVGDKYFHAYAEAGRKVRFDDHAKDGKVAVQGIVNTPEMILANNSMNYAFSGSGSSSIRADKLTVLGSANTSIANVSLSGNTAWIQHGSLELGKNSKMNYTTAVFESGAALKLNSGSAQFDALTLGANSSLFIGANSSLGATSLSVANDVVFQYTALGALLEFDGSLSTSSPIRIDYLNTAVAGSRYALIHFADGLSNWDDLFVSGFGSLSYSSNTLYLNYQPISQKEHGSDFTHLDSTHNNVRLIFNGQASGTVEVNGAISPYAVDIKGGNYVFKDGGAPGILRTTDSITLSGNAVLQSHLATLEGNRINLFDTSHLVLSSSAANTISTLSASSATTVQVSGAETSFQNVTNLGHFIVDETASAIFNNARDLTVAGMVDAAGSLSFRNASSTQGVTYTLSQNNNTLRNVTIGETDSPLSPRVTLAVPGAVSGHFNILADGELCLLGNGKFSATATGSGLLSVAHEATITMPTQNSAALFSNSLNLKIDGMATIGDDNNLMRAKFASHVDISGSLTLYGSTSGSDSDYLSMDALHLDGGKLLFANRYVSSYSYNPFVRKITSLDVADGGGTIVSQNEQGWTDMRATIDVGSLSGTGNLNLNGETFCTLNLFRINDVGETGYSGTITVLHDNITWTDSYDQATILELKSMSMEGAVFIKTHQPCTNPDSNAMFITALGVDGDVELGGLGSSDKPATRVYLYSGYIKNNVTEMVHSSDISSFIDKSSHTLTLNTKDNYSFAGTVYDSLNLVKKGAGEQAFIGDISRFNGSVDVQEGTLRVKNSLSASSVNVGHHAVLLSEGNLNTGASLTMNNGAIESSSLGSSAAQFSGVNTITASAVEGDTWTLHFSTAHLNQAVVTVAGSLTLSGLAVEYDADKLYTADYVLLRSTGTLTLEHSLLNTFVKKETIGGVQYNTLMYKVTDGGLLLPRTTPATLTWVASSGVWVNNHGHNEKVWSADVYNCNFYDGDTVIFSKNADISLDGNLKPASVKVNNVEGSVVFSGSGSIAGTASLNKSAAGKLQINTANTYSGGTSISGGSVIIGHVSALGSGAVSLSGGLLDMSGQHVTNALAISGNATLQGASNYKGQLTLQSGTLAGDTIALNKTAILQSGTVHAKLSGQGGIEVSGNVNLTAANDYAGGTVLKSGQLSILNQGTIGLGAISASGTCSLKVSSTSPLVLKSAISNSGTLSLSGQFDVSGLSSSPIAATHVSTSGKKGNSGFLVSGGYTVQMVSGGKTEGAGAIIKHGADKLDLDTKGVATRAATTDYSLYTLASGDSTGITSIMEVAASKGCNTTSITTTGGSLSLDAKKVSGNLILDGGSLSFLNNTISVDGSLTLRGKTNISLDGSYTSATRYTLISAAGGIDGNCDNLSITTSHPRKSYTLSLSGNSLVMDVVDMSASLSWANEKKAVWQLGAGGWVEGGMFYDGDDVKLVDGTVTISGKVAPGEVTISPTKSLTLKSDKKNPGSISGEASVTITGGAKAKVTMNE